MTKNRTHQEIASGTERLLSVELGLVSVTNFYAHLYGAEMRTGSVRVRHHDCSRNVALKSMVIAGPQPRNNILIWVKYVFVEGGELWDKRIAGIHGVLHVSIQRPTRNWIKTGGGEKPGKSGLPKGKFIVDQVRAMSCLAPAVTLNRRCAGLRVTCEKLQTPVRVGKGGRRKQTHGRNRSSPGRRLLIGKTVHADKRLSSC